MVNYFLGPSEQDKIVGTWHPTGYHGHTRAKSRIEFSYLYRQNAKPKPPEKFIQRITTSVGKHSFSNHDNREAFLSDTSIFDSGLGKRKIRNSTSWNPNFMAWQETVEDKKSNSYYQRDFCRTFIQTKLLTGRKTVEARPLSVYKYSYDSDQVDKADYRTSLNETQQRFNEKNRCKSSISINVANCLVWHDKVGRDGDADNQSKKHDLKSNVKADLAALGMIRPKTVGYMHLSPSANNNSTPTVPTTTAGNVDTESKAEIIS